MVAIAVKVEVVQDPDSLEALIEGGSVEVKALRRCLDVAGEVEKGFRCRREHRVREKSAYATVNHVVLMRVRKEGQRPEDTEIVPGRDWAEIRDRTHRL